MIKQRLLWKASRYIEIEDKMKRGFSQKGIHLPGTGEGRPSWSVVVMQQMCFVCSDDRSSDQGLTVSVRTNLDNSRRVSRGFVDARF